jgi:hypothetical protein
MSSTSNPRQNPEAAPRRSRTMTKRQIERLIEAVKRDPELYEFHRKMSVMLRKYDASTSPKKAMVQAAQRSSRAAMRPAKSTR